MDGGDLCKADVGYLRLANDIELAITRSHTPQLPPKFSVVYRCAADVGDFCEADDGELATARSRTPQFPPPFIAMFLA